MARRTALRGLRLWSAGCATGEEPYSLAILLSELLPADGSWSSTILATDINPAFLARARQALYSSWSFRETPDDLRRRYWLEEDGRWRLRPEIQRMVTFTRLNLAEPCYPSITNNTCALDIIVCRNVTIYFDQPTTQQVAERFYNALAPGGWLIVGHAEPQASVYHQFEVHNFPSTVVYRKPLDAPLFGAPVPSTGAGAPPRPQTGVLSAAGAQRPARPQTGALSAAGAQRPARPQTGALRLPAVQTQPLGEAPSEERLSEILRADPSHSLARIALARLFADRGEWPSARQQALMALEYDPLCIPAHYLLGQIQEHQGQLESALSAYRRTVYLDREFVPGLLGMADVWRALKRPFDAQRCYRNALAILRDLAPDTLVAGADGTAGDLVALITQQLDSLAGQGL
jgi:chemotaxis protein methyltransferase CheR